LRWRVCSQRFLPSSAGRNLPGEQAVFTFWRRKVEPFPARLRRRGGFLLRRCAKIQELVTLKFLMDGHTKTRKLNLGATATVDYRTEVVIAVHIPHCDIHGSLIAVKPAIAKLGAQRSDF
jgi:hypothetical protein